MGVITIAARLEDEENEELHERLARLVRDAHRTAAGKVKCCKCRRAAIGNHWRDSSPRCRDHMKRL